MAAAAAHQHDSASYSTRRCRCGHQMLRLLEPARSGWRCPICGRHARR